MSDPVEPTTLEVGERKAQGALVCPFRLTVLAGPDAGRTVTAGETALVIGTHPSASLVLKDPTVSRFHCELSRVAGRPQIRDLGSSNGTLVDGVSILAAHLKTGSTLLLGKTVLQFEEMVDPVRLPQSERARFGRLAGTSQTMRSVFARLEKAAITDATVLIEAETGTGKELAAESLHLEGPRRSGPFVIVDCAALPEHLLESELFGHEKGAFTGASGTREGAFEAASGGTLLLDEVGELALDLQPKLLRVLESRRTKRLGSNAYLPIDVRVVACTNRDLRSEVNASRFRSDLYYRLAVVEIRMPPLRERLEDLPVLIDDILESLGVAGDPQVATLKTEPFLERLRQQPWPGNVRELRNYLERWLTLREHAVEPPGAPAPDALFDGKAPLKIARERWTRILERRYLTELLEREAGNVTGAARAAGIDRISLYRLLWKYGMR